MSEALSCLENQKQNLLPALFDAEASGSCAYELIQSAPELKAEDFDDPSKQLTFVEISWGSNTIYQTTLEEGESFSLGQELDAKTYALPECILPQACTPVVQVRQGAAYLVAIESAQPKVFLQGAVPLGFNELQASAAPHREISAALLVPLSPNSTARLRYGEFNIAVKRSPAALRGPEGWSSRIDRALGGSFALTALSFLGLAALFALSVPPLGLGNDSGIDKDRLLKISHRLQARAVAPTQEPPPSLTQQPSSDRSGERAEGTEGMAGSEKSKMTNRRLETKGATESRQVARRRMIEEVESSAVIGLMSSIAGTVNGPTSPFGADFEGGISVSANGNIFGDAPGDSYGVNGLALSGLGEGGGGDGEGIGLDSVGDIGGGFDVLAKSRGRPMGSHEVRPPALVRRGETKVTGRLPATVVQRVVRANMGRYKVCYQRALHKNPSLSGRVAVRFLIGSDGRVKAAGDGGSDIPDAGVRSCVYSAFRALSFPEPKGGNVRVTYPLMFSAG